MSILIKGMNMPEKGCHKCREREGNWCSLLPDVFYIEIIACACAEKRHKDCPLVEVPTPHGRLIEERIVRDIIDDVTLLEEADAYTLALITEKLNHDYDFGVLIEAEEE